MEETKMIRRRKLAAAISAAAVATMLFGGVPAANAATPSWCGPKKITMGLTDGFGGNNWRLVTTAAAQDEIKKCKSVTKLLYADGQGNTTKAISDIRGMVAKGVKALVVFPDAGKAMLPALRAAYKAGVKTVPYRVDPSGVNGKDFDIWIGGDFVNDGKNWGNWIKKNFPAGANILFLSGPAGNSQGLDELKGMKSVLTSSTYKFIGESPFEVTNWDGAQTQKVLTAAIAKYPKIDVIVSDFGPVMVSSLGEFAKSGRSIPALATSDGNILGCYYLDNVNKKGNEDFKLMTVATGNDHVRLAVQHAVARATGGKIPAATRFKSPIFEDSETSKPQGVQCNRKIADFTFLSAQMSGIEQQKLLK
jgi:ribose transport system substrate-binding protein